MFYYPVNDSSSQPRSDQQWTDYTLILPAVAVGNVGQLAVDLLLANLNVKHAGSFHHSCILPLVGLDPINANSTRIATSCELFVCDEKKLAIIQQRAPVVPGRSQEYQALLTDWIKSQKFKRTILLSSSFSQFFTMESLQGVPIHYICSNSMKKEESEFLKLNWRLFSIPQEAVSTDKLTIPGGGIAETFLEYCDKFGIPLVILILVCSEGNNYPEAIHMVKSLNTWLSLKAKDSSTEDQWIIPVSWKLPYGNDPPSSIY